MLTLGNMSDRDLDELGKKNAAYFAENYDLADIINRISSHLFP